MLAAKSELNYYPEEDFKRNQNSKKPNRRKRKRPKKNNKSSAKLAYIFIAMAILGISLLILSRYTEITLVRTEITNLEKQRSEMEKIKINLIAELEGIKSSGQIAEDASLKLGMDYPNENQIVYISLEEKKPDKIENENIFIRLKNYITQ